jgi:hypothetical protein
MSDIVERLREAERYGQFGRSLLYSQVADEIERLRAEVDSGNTEILRLRALITEWADAQDKQVSDGGYDPRNIKWPEADIALRRAVGR